MCQVVIRLNGAQGEMGAKRDVQSPARRHGEGIGRAGYVRAARGQRSTGVCRSQQSLDEWPEAAAMIYGITRAGHERCQHQVAARAAVTAMLACYFTHQSERMRKV